MKIAKAKIHGLKLKVTALVGALVLISCIGLAVILNNLAAAQIRQSASEALTNLAVQGANVVESELAKDMATVSTIASRSEIFSMDNSLDFKAKLLLPDLERNEFLSFTVYDLTGAGVSTT
ncbi:MAG: hypothetical protein HGA22_10605 [Clostridiales bacterium]|nr:hypothetical protein [Clostridiales bacterium]